MSSEKMVETGGTHWHQSNRGVSIYICIYLVLLAVVLALSKWLHEHPKVGSVLPEAAMIILVGMITGCIVDTVAPRDNNDGDNDGNDVAQSLLSFSPTVFFVVLLPPIIFNSGYHVRRDLFFRYITPICLYACLGTAICTVVVASILYIFRGIFGLNVSFLELMAFGALISATDPVSTLAVFSSKRVDPHLFYLVFGESVINDAVGLVLFEALAHLIEYHSGMDVDLGQETSQFLFDFVTGFIGSLCLGTVFSLLVAFFFKKVDFRSTPLLELCMYVTIMYFPFVIAEILHLSGIVTVLFTGIASKRYAEPNLSPLTSQNADTVFRLTAHLTETVIFLELGLSVFGYFGVGAFHLGFIIVSLVACLIGRAINIYPITYFFNMAVAARNGIPPPPPPSPLGQSQKNASQTPSPSPPPSPLHNDANNEDHENGYVFQDEEEGTTTTPNKDIIDDSFIPWQKAHMLWFSGLRGAVSYALVRTFPNTGNQEMFIVTTIFVVLVTTFIFGGSTEWALKHLEIPMNVDETEYLKSLRPKPLLFTWLRRLETFYVRPWVIRDFQLKSPTTLDKTMTITHNKRKDGEDKDAALVESDYYKETFKNEQPMVESSTATEMAQQQPLPSTKKESVYDFGQ